MFSTHGTRCMTDFMSNDKRYDYTFETDELLQRLCICWELTCDLELGLWVPRDCSSLLQRQRFIFHPEPGDVQVEMVNKTID